MARIPRTRRPRPGYGGDRCGRRVGCRAVCRPRARHVGRRGSELPAVSDHARCETGGRGGERGGDRRAAGRRREPGSHQARPRHRLDAAGSGGSGGVRSADRLRRLWDHGQGRGLRRLRSARHRGGEGGRGDRPPAGTAEGRSQQQVRRQSDFAVRRPQPEGGQRLRARSGRGGVLQRRFEHRRCPDGLHPGRRRLRQADTADPPGEAPGGRSHGGKGAREDARRSREADR